MVQLNYLSSYNFIMEKISMNNLDSFFKDIFNFKKTSTNIDSLIGEIALVTKDINNLLSDGEVYIKGDYWSSMSEDDNVIKKGTKVKVLEIRGVKLVVRSISEEGV